MGKINYDEHAANIFAENINMMVPYYLMAAYAYYKQDDPIFSDSFFDDMAKTMLQCWDSIEHYHKMYISKNDLEAGTYLGAYPTRVEGALRSLRNGRSTRT
jgi:NAD-dependent DNA ligase